MMNEIFSMSEKFPNQEALAAQAEAEEKAFWKKEMDEWLAKKSEEFKKKPEDELYSSLVNNIHGWIDAPKNSGSFYGAKRTHASLSYYKDKPEQVEEMKRLMKDVDAYIAANNLGGFVSGIARDYSERAELFREGFQSRDLTKANAFQPSITSGEILELKKDLYYAMRRKGYSGVLLRT